MVESTALQLQSISKSYGKNSALKSIDLTIHCGQIVALFGHNGAGKSTLLKLFSTALKPDKGQIHIMGADSNKYPSWCRSQIGYIGHMNYLYPDLSPIENLTFFARLYGVAGHKTRILQVLEDLELKDKSKQPVRNLSNGQQKRVAIARALLHQPSILLMDEADAGLDLYAKSVVKSIVQQVSQSGGTVFFSSHDPIDSLAYANEFILLEKGTLIAHRESNPNSKADLLKILRTNN